MKMTGKPLLLKWLLFLVVIVCVMLLSWGLGWMLALFKVVPPPGGNLGFFAGWTAFPPLPSFLQTMLLAAAVIVPSAAILLPIFLGVVLNVTGVITIAVPEPFAVFSYLAIGWGVGLAFDRDVLAATFHALPWIVVSNLVLILLCGGLGYIVVCRFGIDLLSAYLATSPGGANTIAAIAMTSQVNAPFIMALQVARMATTVLLGPVIARALAKFILP